MLLARDAMTREVVWLQSNRSIKEAHSCMRDLSIRHLVIMDARSQLVGIISEGDLLKRATFANGALKLPETPIFEVMTRKVITCFSNTPLADIAATMITCKVDSVPVIDQGEVVGIITTTDILDMFCFQEETDGHAVMPLEFAERNRLWLIGTQEAATFGT